LDIADRLEAAGYEAWAVGGALRDAHLGRPRADWDLATGARPEETRSLFERTVPLGVEHGTVGVLAADGTMFEVTTFRLDMATDGRHAVVEFADTVDDDLARRDFTINAMAWRPATDELRDPYGGSDDLAARILRAVRGPELRFAEDYLRVLRGLRFAGAYELMIEADTWTALRDAVPFLDRLSAERVREEMLKVLATKTPSRALRLYRESGALGSWYPELAAADEALWESALMAVDALRPYRSFLRVVRLLLAADGGSDGVQREGAAETILRRLKFSNAEIRRGKHLAYHYVPLVNPADSAARLREWLHEVREDQARDLFRLHFATGRASGSEESCRALLYTWARVHDELVRRPPVTLGDLAVGGDDLLELGLPRGPLVGLMLDELLAQVLEAPEANEREELLGRARELIELGGLDRLEDGRSE
jgi:tRNA nucleotidyltransferase (CCA-adding enzyme)